MGKNLIGKRVRLKIGGDPLPPDDAIVGEDITVHVPAKDVGKYNSIVGAKAELIVSREVDNAIRAIRNTMSGSNHAERDEIVAICEEILAEKDKEKTMTRITTLLSVGAKIASIAQFVLQLQQALSGQGL